MNRSADWLHQANADLDQAVAAQLGATVTDLEDRLRILDALYIPTRYPDSLPDGAPTDHFGRLQSDDPLCHAAAGHRRGRHRECADLLTPRLRSAAQPGDVRAGTAGASGNASHWRGQSCANRSC